MRAHGSKGGASVRVETLEEIAPQILEGICPTTSKTLLACQVLKTRLKKRNMSTKIGTSIRP